MTTIPSMPSVAPAPGFAASVMRLVRAAGRRVAMTVRAAIHRSEIRQMLELDDRQLKDIGLVRNDVLGALAQPIVRDPSIVLLVRSVERRSRPRAPEPAAARPQRKTVPAKTEV